jgi:hypothetical protein
MSDHRQLVVEQSVVGRPVIDMYGEPRGNAHRLGRVVEPPAYRNGFVTIEWNTGTTTRLRLTTFHPLGWSGRSGYVLLSEAEAEVLARHSTAGLPLPSGAR